MKEVQERYDKLKNASKASTGKFKVGGILGEMLGVAGGVGLDPHKFIKEIGLSGAGYLEVLSIAHDHLSSICIDILFDLLQVDT